MELLIDVINQKLRLVTNLKHLVEGTKNFIKLTFNLSEEWDDLLTFAQFIQGENAYSQYLDENNSVYLPHEIQAGICEVTLYGTNEQVIATTNKLQLNIDVNNIVVDANSIEITPTLYEQLIAKFNKLSKWQSI